MLAKNINLFLMDGITNGRIKVGVGNWNGIVYKIPRQMLDKCKDIDVLKQSGVYFLFGENEETGQDFIYIGQANIRKQGEGILLRVKEHLNSEKLGFWHTAVFIVKSDSSLGATEISYLENVFYNIAIEANRESGRYNVLNGNEPSQGSVTEEIISDMERFKIEVLQAVSVLGYKVFEKLINKPKLEEDNVTKVEDVLLDEEFYLKSVRGTKSGKNYDAKMVMTLDGFVLLKGSLVIPETKETAPKKYREDKIKYKDILDENNRTTKDILFNSPSGAAVFVVGYNISGPKNWKNNKNLTMEELKI